MDLAELEKISSAMPLEQLSSQQLRELQSALSTLGYGLDCDGVLGPVTKSVWATFKADNALSQPGDFGPGALAVLRQRLSSESAHDVPHQAVNLVKSFEGFSAKPYDDGTGVWTIGYGTTVYPDGRRVSEGDDNVTQSEAYNYLAHDMKSTLQTLASTVAYWSSMNSNQRSALISFGYNLGGGFYGATGFNSISAALRNHRWSDVPRIFPLYSDPGDPAVHQGLLRRRIAEGDLWQGRGPFAESV